MLRILVRCVYILKVFFKSGRRMHDRCRAAKRLTSIQHTLINVIFERPALNEWRTVYQNLTFLCILLGIFHS